MPLWHVVALLGIGSAKVATAAASSRIEKQLPFEIGYPSRADQHLRGSLLGLEPPFASVAFDAIPLQQVSLGLPEDVDLMEGPPVVDGPLRDLLDFGSAMGSAVLRQGPPHQSSFGGVGGKLGSSLELPINALHVKMQEEVPAPLSMDDAHGRLRIYGTLPKKLTAKTLKVSLSGDGGRDLVVQYFLGQGADAKNAVGIEESFALDFAPADSPTVKYKSATGVFELLLPRPAADPRKQVTIDFDMGPSAAVARSAIKPEQQLAMVKPSEANAVKVVAHAAPAKAVMEPTKASSVEVKPSEANAVKVVAHAAPAKAVMKPTKATSVEELPHGSKLARLRASEVDDWHAAARAIAAREGLGKKTKELHELVRTEAGSYADKDQAKRVKEVADRAKQFVADAHLGEAQKELSNAFAPLDLGLVMLEMSHRIRAH